EEAVRHCAGREKKALSFPAGRGNEIDHNRGRLGPQCPLNRVSHCLTQRSFRAIALELEQILTEGLLAGKRAFQQTGIKVDPGCYRSGERAASIAEQSRVDAT